MICRQCTHEFCWVCMKDWKGHNDFYSCNRYQKKSKRKTSSGKKSKKRSEEEEKEAFKTALERYLHYYTRYINHSKSQELEKVCEQVLSDMKVLQETEATAAELSFLPDATKTLGKCRLALKYSYVVGYYLHHESPQSRIFELLQEDLEKTVEQLSEILDTARKEGIVTYRRKVLHLTELATTRYANMLDMVEHGIEGGCRIQCAGDKSGA